MNSKESSINKKPYIKPEVSKVAVDTSLVLMAPSNPNHHHGHTHASKGDGLNEPSFQSPFGDKPFS
jgi:hypothetical protein